TLPFNSSELSLPPSTRVSSHFGAAPRLASASDLPPLRASELAAVALADSGSPLPQATSKSSPEIPRRERRVRDIPSTDPAAEGGQARNDIRGHRSEDDSAAMPKKPAAFRSRTPAI